MARSSAGSADERNSARPGESVAHDQAAKLAAVVVFDDALIRLSASAPLPRCTRISGVAPRSNYQRCLRTEPPYSA
jgi:hypothetical protein